MPTRQPAAAPPHSRERLRAMHLSDLQPLPQERRYQATLRNGNGAHLPLR